MSLIKAIVPFFCILITRWENWDFASTRVKNEIWKLFLANLLNLVTICVISAEFVLRKTYFRSQPIMSELAEFACREDQVGTSFLKLTLTDFLVGIVVTELVNWLWRLVSGKSEFSTSGETVSLLYFQSLAWVSLLFYPFLAVFMPLIFYIRFKYGYYVFHYHRRVPNESYASSVTPVTT
eukprot:TRINITY_DN12452_c0_g1_i11.p3 TRINITY_DN12452_c0_g1~~TRINITY_DN12452_c0_g1_i11.p3  ORF type:complete len:180 (+),score=46.43 TRINITY_DN12452_c0_g1_i11:1543-2082(+)